MRTGIIQPLPGIGDMIWLLPALKAIAAATPGHKIILLTRDLSQADIVLAGEPWLQETIHLPRKRGALAGISNLFHTWKTLRQARLDCLYILHQSARYRLAAQLAGIKHIRAYPKSLAAAKDNGWIKSLMFLEHLGITVANPMSQLNLSDGVRKTVQQFDKYLRPWFVLSPGASEPTRCWPAASFAACADGVIELRGGTVFVTGTKKEGDRIMSVHQQCRYGDRVVPVIGVDFGQVMALIDASEGILGNDSGPINVAAALGRPAFALCGISRPALHSPHLILIEPDQPGDQAAASNGMERISVAHVMAVLRDKLKPQAD